MPWAWLVLSALGGAGFFAAAMFTGVLAQPRPRWRVQLRAAGAAFGVAATVGAVAGERWNVVSRAITDRIAELNTGSFGLIAVVAVAAAGAAALLVRRMLPHFPGPCGAGRSARAGTVLLAAAFLNVPLLTWIAEDSHWRGRRLESRPWPWPAAVAPRLRPAFVLAWADWRRLGRRPAVLTALAVSTPGPRAGRAHGWVTAAVLLAGRCRRAPRAPPPPGATPTTRRCGGCSAWTPGPPWSPAPCCPLCSAPRGWSSRWRCSRCPGNCPVRCGRCSGWSPGPGVAAAALRIARTAPVNPANQGSDTPTLRAVFGGHVHASTFGAQVAVSAVVLGGYLTLAVRSA